MKMPPLPTLLLLLPLLLSGCVTAVRHRDQARAQPPVNSGEFRLVLPPFLNATDHEHAGQALTQLMGSALLEAGLPLVQTEEILSQTADESAPKQDVRYQKLAQDHQANYLIMGTVHEYRYKSDLNANPAVGITLRLVDVPAGRTLWQGSASKVGRMHASLTSTAQKAVRELVARLPLKIKP